MSSIYLRRTGGFLFVALLIGVITSISPNGIVFGAFSTPTSMDSRMQLTESPIAGPALSLPAAMTANPGMVITVPVNYISNNNSISSIAFSIDFDQTLISFDSKDENGDGIPDAIKFFTPIPFDNPSVMFDPADTDGELDFLIADFSVPLSALNDGVIATIDFTIGNSPISQDTGIRFSDDPKASFGSNLGKSIPGSTSDCLLYIYVPPPPKPSLQLESPAAIRAGNPFFLDVDYSSNTKSISSLAFSIDYDPDVLIFDPKDENGDGIPDSILFDLPSGFEKSMSFDIEDQDGELDIVVFDPSVPLNALPDSVIVKIRFVARTRSDDVLLPIRFSNDPPVSFGDVNGKSVEGQGMDCNLYIVGGNKFFFPIIQSQKQ